MKFALNLFRLLMCTALTTLMGSIIYYNEKLPDSYYVTSGSELVLNEYIEVHSDSNIPENYVVDNFECYQKTFADINALSHTEQLRLFGIFPIKNVTVNEVGEPVVVPCGTPFGIKLQTEGVLVVELTGFDTGDGFSSPAREAGISEGDIILSISGNEISSNKDVSRIIEDSSGQTLGVELIRDGQKRVVFIKPSKAAADGCYRAGMWVRDSSAGIGTVTFYDPATKIFAGLGHPVCDSDTGNMLTMSEGEAAKVIINGVKKSCDGSPGELMGMFASSSAAGRLLLNDVSGVYGQLDECPSYMSAVPVAMRQEIKVGEAEILTTVSGTEPERYSVEIEKISLDSNDCRNLVVHVTDERLLNDAGGIVQGMSGSPIIQDGKLIGAVTHVLVRDPTRGYGIFADTMLYTAENAAQLQ